MTLPTQRVLMTASVVVMFAVIGIVALDPLAKPTPASLIERCEEKDGEWLYNSDRRVCILADGTWLQYDLASDDFVSPQVQVPIALAAEPEPEIAESWNEDVATCEREPQFEDYPMVSMYDGRLASVDFSTNKAAEHHRTAIRKDMVDVNFGGRYVFSYWGCGEGCKGSAVIDGETGEILMYGLKARSFDFVSDSRLLIVNSNEYYAVEDDVFRQVCR